MNQFLRDAADEIASRAERELEALVAVSSPSGDLPGAEEAVALCAALLPAEASLDRVASSTPGSAPDLIARISGTGKRRMLLVGHIDTVHGHESHGPLRREGDRLYGPGTADMKGGVVLALGVSRALATRPNTFDELSVLLVTDEEWRTHGFCHVHRFEGYDACLCFEAGELGPNREEAVIVKRKAAGTLRVRATGRPSHSGSAPDQGANALLALAQTAIEVSQLHAPHGPDRLSVVPTIVRSGEAFNVVPPAGELILDIRSDRASAFDAVLGAVPGAIGEVSLEAGLERLWPGMDSSDATRDLLARASSEIGRPIIGVGRGGASDASHFAGQVELTVDGLGPRGGGAHTLEEFALAPSLRERAEVALAIAVEALA